jgi:hypothetical protein
VDRGATSPVGAEAARFNKCNFDAELADLKGGGGGAVTSTSTTKSGGPGISNVSHGSLIESSPVVGALVAILSVVVLLKRRKR